ncbi:surfactin synthase thioesterase subunit [Yimella lutea]|uniref:Surfactin synthase thioesterase subunit n=1 Tax=Yimella lutea TaxID=587872 RepID=A0A542EGP8_9MICO|nr:alpha/beta fold hydrolase [Yimella lutea]TQJ14489.1 surfactin synthase thioesterase subunit [Yimella lutea]
MTHLLFFPGAGSFGTEFATLGRSLPFASAVIDYPGRRGATFGHPPESFRTVVDHCMEQVRGTESRRQPVALLGHSYGAYVAWETAMRLEAEGTSVRGLFLAGAASPSHDTSRLPVTVPEVRRYFDRVDPHLLTSAPSSEWADIICETAADDLRLLRDYRTQPRGADSMLAIPATVCRGEQDTLVDRAALEAWGEFCSGPFSSIVFAGGHSDYLTTSTFASWLTEQVHQLASGPEPTKGVNHDE